MTLQDLYNAVKSDLGLDKTELDTESLRIPQLHNKYLIMFHDERLRLTAFKTSYSKLYKDKWEYYTGKMSEERLKELAWEPFDLKILRQDVEIYLQSDSQLLELKGKLSIQEEKVDYLSSVLKGITNRQFHIRDAITWRKFLDGSM